MGQLINVNDLFGWSKAWFAPAPLDPFEVERRWIVASDGRTYREFATGSPE